MSLLSNPQNSSIFSADCTMTYQISELFTGKTADLAAVVLQEGLAHVCLVRQSMTITKAKIEVPIPRKRRGSCTNHDKVKTRSP